MILSRVFEIKRINGALNILRKYLIKNAISEFSVIQKIIDRGLFFRPSRITIY